MEDKSEHVLQEMLQVYLEGKLAEDEVFLVDHHLGICDECAERFARLRSVDFAFEGWTARKHAELLEARQRVVDSLWREENGVYRIAWEIRNQIYEHALSAAVWLFLGHRRLQVVHLGKKTRIDSYSILLPGEAGKVNIRMLAGETGDDIVSFVIEVILKDVEAGTENIELSILRVSRGREEPESRRVIWKGAIPVSRAIETSRIPIKGDYMLRISVDRGMTWELPLPTMT